MAIGVNIVAVVLNHHLVDAQVKATLCHRGHGGNHSNQCQYYFLIHLELLIVDGLWFIEACGEIHRKAFSKH